MKAVFVILSLLSLTLRLSAYQEPDWSAIENYLEEIYSANESSDALDRIEYYIRRPIYLKSATVQDLLKLPTIDYQTADRIISKISENPNMSYFALFDELNISDVQKQILYFTTSLDEKPIKQQKRYHVTYSIRNEHRFEKVRGLEEKRYVGDEFDIYQKLRVNVSGFELNALCNKDLGEPHLAEYYSGSLKYSAKNISLIIGDFSLNSGFGNVFGPAFSMGKGSDFIGAAMSYGSFHRPNSSTIPTNSMRGASVDYKFQIAKSIDMRIIPFFAMTKRNASIDASGEFATSIYTAGYFRTPNEIAKKNTLDERAGGLILDLTHGRLNVGGVLASFDYSKPLASKSSSVIVGKSGFLSSLFVNFSSGKFGFGCEASLDANSESGIKAIASYRDETISGVLHFRNFSAGFRSPYGSNFGEFSYLANEAGLYAGLSTKLSDVLRLEAYLDLYKSHTRTYFVQMPIRGRDLVAKLSALDTDYGDFVVRFKEEVKTDGVRPEGSANQVIYDLSRRELRLEWSEKIGKKLNLRMRFDAAHINFDEVLPYEWGFASYAELKYSIISSLDVKGRIAFFETDSYSSSIWHFEYRMPTSAMSSALFESGYRSMFTLSYKPLDFINIYIAYARLVKPSKTTLGSGYEQIKGSADNRIYSMIVIKL